MIIMPKEFSLIQRQPHLPAPYEPVAQQGEPLAAQLLFGAEQVGIVTHIKHAHGADSPGVLVFLFVYEHRHPAVDFCREFGILPGTENGGGFGVRVDVQKIFPAQREDPALVLQVEYVVQEESEL